jgi:pimeloyl-ACP methyl ester carboxylesterase
VADVVANGVRLHVQRLGSPHAPVTVVFLHGLVMDNLSSWYFSVAHVAAQKADVVLYDLRGHGRSERPQTGYGLADLVLDLDALLGTLGIDRQVVLVGNSFGGLLALAFAIGFADRVAGMVLVDAHLGDEGFAAEMAGTLSLEGEARDRRIAESFRSWAGRHSERKRNRLAETARELVGATSLVDDMRATSPLSGDALRTVTAPVLALYGERSDLRARGEASLAPLPRCRIEIVPGATHSVLWEATGHVRKRILEFLDEIAP